MYYLYILLCSDNSLYTGITNNLDTRMEAHRNGKGSKYVRSHSPFKLIYKEKFEAKSDSLKREAEIKSWSRTDKIENLKLKI